MRYSFLLAIITDSPWAPIILSALSPFGEGRVVTHEDVLIEVMSHHYDAIILDAQHVDDIVNLTEEVFRIDRTTRVIVATESPNWRTARAVFRAGGADYIMRSFDVERLRRDIQETLALSLPTD